MARKTITDIITQIATQQITELDEANLKLANNKIIYVMGFGGQPSASNAARLLAAQSAQSGRNVILCDTTGQSEKEINKKTSSLNNGMPIKNASDKISVITGAIDSSFFTSKNFDLTIKDLAKEFDQIFICTSNRNAQLGLMALLDFTPSLVIISSLRKTKKADIKNIKTKQPVDLLFYD